MANLSLATGRGISLDEMIALADEMAAIARAGVPLETALVESAPTSPCRAESWRSKSGVVCRPARD